MTKITKLLNNRVLLLLLLANVAGLSFLGWQAWSKSQAEYKERMRLARNASRDLTNSGYFNETEATRLFLLSDAYDQGADVKDSELNWLISVLVEPSHSSSLRSRRRRFYAALTIQGSLKKANHEQKRKIYQALLHQIQQDSSVDYEGYDVIRALPMMAHIDGRASLPFVEKYVKDSRAPVRRIAQTVLGQLKPGAKNAR